MDSLVSVQKIAPELADVVARRYGILRTVRFGAPIGRRALAVRLALPERLIRKETDAMRTLGLLQGDSSGMEISLEGVHLLQELEEVVRHFQGLSQLEFELGEALGIQKVVIVPGDSDRDLGAKKGIATATGLFLQQVLRDGDTMAVTGGTTLSEVATSLPEGGIGRRIMVVPARGGLGEDVELQANTIAARLAGRFGGSYRLLHAPEHVLPGLRETILSEPQIREVMALGRRSKVLLHGIGTAEEMAKRRNLDDADLMQLIADGAVGEAFGYYFDTQGNIVYNSDVLGISLADLKQIPLVVAVGGGRRKAWAVLSVLSTGYCDVCITDEGAARRLISLKQAIQAKD